MDTFAMRDAYKAAKAAKVGETVTCPCGCQKRFVKRSYQQAFRRNKGPGNCKDRYWNRADMDRADRAFERRHGCERDSYEAYLRFEVHPFSDEALGQD